jgi:phosphate:Na+ symporter
MQTAIQTLGGLGIFLLGMIVMTDGLRLLAGNVIRKALMRFTHSPLTGAVTGAVSTAILQSSSATTVTAVGFVSVGLLSFPEALGIIFGANIGTTITGWMVALLGFKLKLSTLVLPVILLGALLRLFTKGHLAHVGHALAGFGLIFVGITFMQEGMANLQTIAFFTHLPADTFVGRLKLVLIGMLFTVITQSSSAGVASALTALFTGLISFEQAAAMVIGMDIGTTVTAALATIGGSVDARRTGYSHVIYNFLTGIFALILLTPYIAFWEKLAPGSLMANAEIALVAFHTTFNTLGVILVLPFTAQFARFMQNLVPEKIPLFTRRLSPALLEQPTLALNAAHTSINEQILELFQHLLVMLGDLENGKYTNLHQLDTELDKTHTYIDQIHLESGNSADWERLLAMIHTLDHLQRLLDRCIEQKQRAVTARQEAGLEEIRQLLTDGLLQMLQQVKNKNWNAAVDLTRQTSNDITEKVKPYRIQVMEQIAEGSIDVPTGTERLEAVRWLRRVSNHITSITHHFADAVQAIGK